MKQSVLQPSAQQNTHQSVEQSIIQKYLEHIDRLPPLWLDSDTVDKRKFSMQLEFIISMIPFEEIRKKIKTERAALEKEYKASTDPDIRKDPEIRAGFAAVTGVMGFIFEKFELVHDDIVGPGTTKEFQKQVIEIPDVDTDRVKQIEDTSSAATQPEKK